MYWAIDGFCFLAGTIQLIKSMFCQDWIDCILAFIWIWIYPLFLEGTSNLLANFIDERTVYQLQSKSRIVYSQTYNLSLWGLEKLHPFDSQKYKHIFSKLVKKKVIYPFNIIKPNKCSRKFLLQKMGKKYLLKMCFSFHICKYIELPFFFLPSFMLRWRVLNPMLYATQGSILAACAAKQLGWAINLSGGFHHASWERGGGFCIYPDISLTVHYLQSRLGLKRIMIIDLDAHQGNGHQRDHVIDQSVYIIDFYNHKIYPKDNDVKEAISKDIQIQPTTSNQQYLQMVDSIQDDISQFGPEFVIYNAGTDILANDPLGRLEISPETIIKRDQKIISMCLNHSVPVTMLLSGGYQFINAEIIADSIQNLFNKFDRNQ